ncbi:sulfatase-like hydrolase/transferase [Roseateles sp. BYS180W]|uniref:Sulfatase-like hydrolase/transferase n=1 Tax=Roseateles rivi TaxID=3299028 RepID=A0ABW7FY80_9BURK
MNFREILFVTSCNTNTRLSTAAAPALAQTAFAASSPATARPGRAPHIVFIMADDLGWADLSCFGQTDYSTPHLDALAASGVRMRQAYAASPVCSPSRTALITGRYHYRLRMGLEEPIPGPKSTQGLPNGEGQLPLTLAAAGYHCALVGKWHLGCGAQYSPQRHGNLGGGLDYFSHRDRAGRAHHHELAGSAQARGERASGHHHGLAAHPCRGGASPHEAKRPKPPQRRLERALTAALHPQSNLGLFSLKYS